MDEEVNLPAFQRKYRLDMPACQFSEKNACQLCRPAGIPRKMAFAVNGKSLFFFQRHAASLQSRFFKNPALRFSATADFPVILAGKTCRLPFLQKFRLCRQANCLFYGNSGFVNLAPVCIFFPEAFRITENGNVQKSVSNSPGEYSALKP
jgi:hypothetical protein